MSGKISVPGNYSGYSSPRANGYRRRSSYIPLKDGCRIAWDRYLPTRNGEPLDGPLPTVILATGYRRAWPFSKDDAAQHVVRRYPHLREGDTATHVNLSSVIDRDGRGGWPGKDTGDLELLAEWVRLNGSTPELLLLFGYAFAVIDVRGTGASFGTDYADGWQAGKDLAEIFEFFVKKPWCDGNLGMIGVSWAGGAQYFVMNYGTPHLKAAIPQMAGYDAYYGWYPGGAYLAGFFRQWSRRRESEDREQAALPVDDDTDGRLRDQALEERRQVAYPTDEELDEGRNAPDMPTMARDEMLEMFPVRNRPLADGTTIDLDYQALDFKRANLNGTAVYFFAGWFDMFPRDVIVAYWNYTGPKKLIVGPWHHNNYWDREEALRWFDRWLKGIDNGVADEPPVAYSTQGSDGYALGWNAASDWPVSGPGDSVLFHLGSHIGGSRYSRNDGALSKEAPRSSGEFDRLTVDYRATAGTGARSWYHSGPFLNYSPLAENNRKGLTYTSAPLDCDLELGGHPELILHLSTTAETGIVVAYLEEVDADGYGRFLTEVVQNLEYRDIQSTCPIEMKRLCYRSYHSSTRRKVTPGEVFELRVDMLPVSCVIRAGRRLRLSIHGADLDNYYTIETSPPPVLSIWRDAARPSRLSLPVVEPGPAREALRIPGAFEGCPDRSRHALEFRR